MPRRRDNKKAPGCECGYNFTCRACLEYYVLIAPAVHAEPQKKDDKENG